MFFELIRELRYSEIEHLYVTVRSEHYVLWLYVAMNYSGLMRCHERVGHLYADVEDFYKL